MSFVEFNRRKNADVFFIFLTLVVIYFPLISVVSWLSLIESFQEVLVLLCNFDQIPFASLRDKMLWRCIRLFLLNCYGMKIKLFINSFVIFYIYPFFAGSEWRYSWSSPLEFGYFFWAHILSLQVTLKLFTISVSHLRLAELRFIKDEALRTLHVDLRPCLGQLAYNYLILFFSPLLV